MSDRKAIIQSILNRDKTPQQKGSETLKKASEQASKDSYVAFMCRLPPELHKALKRARVENDKTINDLIIEALKKDKKITQWM